MATNLFTTSVPITFSRLDGGLNSTSGPLGVKDNESSDLQNVDFDKFGSVMKRNGYVCLNTTPCSPSGTSQGLYWYTSLFDRNAILVEAGKIFKMDALDGSWDDITGAVSFATGGIDTYTKLLLHCDGTNGSSSFVDSSLSGHSITSSGTTLTTAQYKFATASAIFSTSQLSISDHADWNYGTGDFTIDTWVRFNSVSARQVFYSQRVDNNNFVTLEYSDAYATPNYELVFTSKTGGVTDIAVRTPTWAPIINTWYHIEITRNSNTWYIFIDGISQTLTLASGAYTATLPDLAASVLIGQFGDGSNYLNCWLDEFRVSKGIARWTANFTPPTKSYGDYLPQDFDTFLGNVLGTDSENTPWQWTVNNTTASNMTVVTGLTGAKFVKKFQNYCILANVKVSGVRYPSRFYWSAIRSITTWNSADWIEVSKDDGDEITGLKVLGDRLVVYKNNSIYLVIFTGDADIPFLVQKSNSAVGCVAPYSIQEAENGHIFVAQDGIYFFDGYNSFKMSDRINDSFGGLNKDKLSIATSMYQRTKNTYYLSCPSGTSLYNNFVLTWNSFLNAWSKYAGMSASNMAIFMVDSTNERPYFSDDRGYVYRADNGSDDYPANSISAIDSYYYTNWKHYDDICDKKGIPHIYLVHRNESSTNLTFSYSYDFYNGDQYLSSFSLFTTQTVTALTTRRDLQGRGRFVRFKFANSQTSTSYRIDGVGTYVTKESRI